jgi:hypothetical protein
MIPRLKRHAAAIELGLVIVGALLVIACRAYQFAFRPEWTEAQAFREMWRLWLAAIAVLLTALGIRWRMQR